MTGHAWGTAVLTSLQKRPAHDRIDVTPIRWDSCATAARSTRVGTPVRYHSSAAFTGGCALRALPRPLLARERSAARTVLSHVVPIPNRPHWNDRCP